MRYRLPMRLSAGEKHLRLLVVLLAFSGVTLLGQKEFYEPTKVATPPANAFRSLWRAGDGSIQSFGFTGTFSLPGSGLLAAPVALSLWPLTGGGERWLGPPGPRPLSRGHRTTFGLFNSL